MKRYLVFLLCLLASVWSISLKAQAPFSAETAALLDTLEAAIENKSQYAAHREREACCVLPT